MYFNAHVNKKDGKKQWEQPFSVVINLKTTNNLCSVLMQTFMHRPHLSLVQLVSNKDILTMIQSKDNKYIRIRFVSINSFLHLYMYLLYSTQHETSSFGSMSDGSKINHLAVLHVNTYPVCKCSRVELFQSSVDLLQSDCFMRHGLGGSIDTRGRCVPCLNSVFPV